MSSAKTPFSSSAAEVPTVPPSRPSAELPDGYHLENFITLLDYVTTIYPDLLDKSDHHFAEGFRSVSREAQSLYVRLLMRKGPAFRVDKLQYPDVPHTLNTLKELETVGLTSLYPLTDPITLLNLLRKQELEDLARSAGIECQPRRKDSLIQTIAEQLPQEIIHGLLKEQIQWVLRLQDLTVRRLKLLFFGNARQDFSEFITTQLGIVRYENYPIDHDHCFFQSKTRLLWLEELTDILQWWDEQAEEPDATSLMEALEHLIQVKQAAASATETDAYIVQKAERMITRLARHLERLAPEQALPVFQHSLYPPSRERQARILEKQGDYDKALQLIEAVETSPSHPDEPETLQALKSKLHKKLGAAPVTGQSRTDQAGQTRQEFKTRHIKLTKTDNLIELQVADHLSEREGVCLPLENQLFCGLFGLFFWDIIFSPRPDAFFNPYQLGPKDLWSDSFYSNRKAAIDERLSQLHESESLPKSALWQNTMLQHARTKTGIANYFVNWAVFSPAMIELLTAHIPAHHLHAVFTKILEHPGYYRNGFPDLIVLNDTGYHLWEVKGPTDTLQKNQKRWLGFFNEHRIPAGVLHVEWESP